MIRNLLVCMVLLLSFSASAEAFRLETTPDGASIFQKVRGKYYFVGYTPMVLERSQLQDKAFVELLLLKYGYQDVTRKLDLVNGVCPATVPLIPLAQPGTTATTKACEKKIAAELETYLASHPQPFKLGSMSIGSDAKARRFLYIGMQLVQYDQLYAIRRAKRVDSRGVNELVDEIVRPVVEPILGLAGQSGCLSYFQVDVGYRASKRFKLSLETTPTVDRYYRSWSEQVGHTVYQRNVTITQLGRKTSYKSKLVHDSGNKLLSLRYELR